MTSLLRVAAPLVFGLVSGLALGLTSELAAADPALLAFSAQELQRIQRHGPWPPGPPTDAGNALSGNAQAIALGQLLFSDKRLSVGSAMSCATCHIPEKAFSDGRARGLGREPLDRNTPSIWNAGHERWYGWDGAADSIWSQSIRALSSTQEMNTNAAHIAKVIQGDDDLACRWQQLFGQAVADDPQNTLVHAAKALGAFNASLVSAPTPFDEFRVALAQGDTAGAARYPPDAQRGLRIFVGRGQCHLCHTGPLFSNGEFADIGMPFFVRPGEVDTGRHGGIQALEMSAYNLLSRWADPSADSVKTRHVALQHRNFGEFKVPSLRNLSHTAPYMHDGQLPTLESVVNHYSNLNLDRLHADGDQILQPLRLAANESADLVAFLRTLSSPQSGRWQPAPLAPCR